MTPYRTPADMPELVPMSKGQIYNLGIRAIHALNAGCPKGIIVEPRDIEVLKYEREVRHYHYGPMVVKHSIRYIMSFPHHWREPCCQESISDFLRAELLSGWYGWKWRLAKRKHLQIQMFQGVVTREDFQKLLEELRGFDELVQDSSYPMRRRRTRLHVRAGRALRRLISRRSSCRSS